MPKKKAKAKVKEHPHFHIDVYDLCVNVIFDDDWHKIAQNLFDKEKLDLDITAENTEAYAIKIEDKKGFYMFFYKNASNKTIYHECIHILFYITIVCGLNIDPHDHESLAYLAEYIISETMKIKGKK